MAGHLKERKHAIKRVGKSVDKVLSIAKAITTLKIKLPKSGETMSRRTMLITPRHKSIDQLFDEDFWTNY
ncbi:hypothetical protein D7D25_07970 [Proteiniphilum sp. X52]|nr:hypothetical protein D7D25_07970 [Proteiniphilum sp. X52]